jgi:hypothetical protein
MKVLLDVKDSKAAFLMEVLNSFPFVRKATPISSAKAELLEDLREAVEELKLVRQGKLEARDAESLLDEL